MSGLFSPSGDLRIGGNFDHPARYSDMVAAKNEKRNLKLYLTLPLSLVFFAMSVGIIPLFMRLTSSPWNSIRLFAPDIAYMTLGIVAILAWMGLVLMYGTLVNRRKQLESVTRRT